MSKPYHILLALAFALLMLACSDESTLSEKGNVDRTVNIAVILPIDSYDRWSRIIQMIQKNISDATDLYPVIKFYDEDNSDIMLLAYELARDKSIHCVIGCEKDENTEILAYQMSLLKEFKPMFTFTTSQDIIRKYSRKGFMWGLSESDITECEVLLAQIAQHVYSSDVALIANSSSSGQTFVDWFAFQASELGLNPRVIYTYDSISEIAPILKEHSIPHCPIVCVPNTPEEAAEMVKYTNFGYYSHVAFDKETLEIISATDEAMGHGMFGVSLVPDPNTGFHDVYVAKYGEAPIFGEAQLYDAIMVTCLAYAVAEEFDMSLNNAVAELLATDGSHLGGWTQDAIQWNFTQITEGHTIPSITGATGNLDFSPNKHTIINKSTYAVQFWVLSDFHTTDYVSRDGEGGGSSIYGAWIWNKAVQQEFYAEQEDTKLPSLEGNKAVLIASSMGWNNYRHQADILAYYQMLKKNKFTDDDIILIMADDLVFNTLNPYPGVISREETPVNLYDDVHVDYTLEQISPKNLKNILLGKPTEEFPIVLNSQNQDNVLFVWSGHGSPGVLHWNQNQQSITGKYLSDIFSEMYSSGNYRKLFGIIEACYGGSVASQCEGIPNLLMMTAANDKETSKAELYSTLWETYLTNSFTASVINTIQKKSDNKMSIKDLYLKAFNDTMGSHVTLYNVNNFGNVFFNYVDEYFYKSEKWPSN